jgi:hypothetical protein
MMYPKLVTAQWISCPLAGSDHERLQVWLRTERLAHALHIAGSCMQLLVSKNFWNHFVVLSLL